MKEWMFTKRFNPLRINGLSYRTLQHWFIPITLIGLLLTEARYVNRGITRVAKWTVEKRWNGDVNWSLALFERCTGCWFNGVLHVSSSPIVTSPGNVAWWKEPFHRKSHSAKKRSIDAWFILDGLQTISGYEKTGDWYMARVSRRAAAALMGSGFWSEAHLPLSSGSGAFSSAVWIGKII